MALGINLFDVVGGRATPNIPDALAVTKALGPLKNTGPMASINRVQDKQQEKKTEGFENDINKAKARSAKLQEIVEFGTILKQKQSKGGVLTPEEEKIVAMADSPVIQQLAGIDPDKLGGTSGGLGGIFQDGGTTQTLPSGQTVSLKSVKQGGKTFDVLDPIFEEKKRKQEEKLGVTDFSNKFEKVAEKFTGQRDGFVRLRAAAADPSPAGDLAMIFNYMKILDPGSVVRESEFRTAAQTGSLPQRVQAAYNQITNGQKLSAAQRADFTNRGEALFNAANSQFEKDSSSFRDLAIKNGLDPDLFIRDVSVTDGDVSGTPAFGQNRQALKEKYGLR